MTTNTPLIERATAIPGTTVPNEVYDGTVAEWSRDIDGLVLRLMIVDQIETDDRPEIVVETDQNGVTKASRGFAFDTDDKAINAWTAATRLIDQLANEGVMGMLAAISVTGVLAAIQD